MCVVMWDGEGEVVVRVVRFNLLPFDNFRRCRADDGKETATKNGVVCALLSLKAGGGGPDAPHCKARLTVEGN